MRYRFIHIICIFALGCIVSPMPKSNVYSEFWADCNKIDKLFTDAEAILFDKKEARVTLICDDLVGDTTLMWNLLDTISKSSKIKYLSIRLPLEDFPKRGIHLDSLEALDLDGCTLNKFPYQFLFSEKLRTVSFEDVSPTLLNNGLEVLGSKDIRYLLIRDSLMTGLPATLSSYTKLEALIVEDSKNVQLKISDFVHLKNLKSIRVEDAVVALEDMLGFLHSSKSNSVRVTVKNCIGDKHPSKGIKVISRKTQ